MTTRTSLLLACLPLFLFTACGGTVQSDGNGGSASSSGPTGSTTGTSGTGASTSATTGTGASTSTSTTTSTGTGGATSTTTGTGGATSTTSGTGGGACVGFVDLVVGNGAPVHLTSDCASDTWNPGMATTAVGYLMQGGPPPGESALNVFGCASKAAGSKGLWFSVTGVKAPGTFTSGTATYSDGQGADWTNGATLEVKITALGAVGDSIVGSFSAEVIHPPMQIAQMVTATFSVCHIQDEDVP